MRHLMRSMFGLAVAGTGMGFIPCVIATLVLLGYAAWFGFNPVPETAPGPSIIVTQVVVVWALVIWNGARRRRNGTPRE